MMDKALKLQPKPNQPSPAFCSALSEPPCRGVAQPYLKCSAVGGCQLPLVIEHLLKVGDMPVLVSGVAVKALQRPSGYVSTFYLLGLPGVYL